jgi:hypothetical protein
VVHTKFTVYSDPMGEYAWVELALRFQERKLATMMIAHWTKE